MSRRDRDPNRGNRSIPLSWHSAADELGLNDDECWCGAETFHTSTGLLGRCTLPQGHAGAHSAVGPWR